MESFLIGKFVKVHGIKGELKLYPYTDDMDNLSKVKKLFLDDKLSFGLKVTSCKFQGKMLIFKFQNINSIEEATNYVNKDVYIPKEDISDIEDTYYIEDLIGCEVFEENGNLLGSITDVFNTGANDVYEIDVNQKKVYIPAIKQVIKDVDIKNKKVVIELMKGLI